MDKECLFCDSRIASEIQSHYMIKIVNLFGVTTQEKLLHKRLCGRCILNLDAIENASRMRDMMTISLNEKLDDTTKRTEATNANITDNNSHIATIQSNIPAVELIDETSKIMPVHSWTASPMTSSRIQKCRKCNINLKTRPLKDAMKHINRCNGQGLKRGRPSRVNRADIYPCSLCRRKFATKEVYQIHITKCNGSMRTYNRGRKPADNTCMLCGEDLVYRHILKKHLRLKHGINAQRLDDSVINALRTGETTGNNVKEQVLTRIQLKMGAESATNVKEEYNTDQGTEDDQYSLGETENSLNDQTRCTRSRKMVRPSKYVAGTYTCGLCNKEFESSAEVDQHDCLEVQDDNMPAVNLEDLESTLGL